MAQTYYNSPQACNQVVSAPVSSGGCGCSSTGGGKKEAIYSLELLKGLLLANGKPIMDLACELINTPDFIAALNEWFLDQAGSPEFIKELLASPDFDAAMHKWLLAHIDDPEEIAAIEAALAKSPNFAAIVNKVADLTAIAKKDCAALVAIPAPTKVLAYGADCTEFGAAVVTKRELGVFSGGADFAAHGSMSTGINLPAGRYIIRARFRGVLSGTTVGGVGETIFEVSAGTYLEFNAHSSFFTAGAVNYGHTIETVILVDLAAPAEVKVILKGGAAGEGPGIKISGNANVTAFEIPKYMVTLGV